MALYEVEVNVRYNFEIEAESQEEAEEIGFDEFMDSQDFWDAEVDAYLLSEDEDDEED